MTAKDDCNTFEFLIYKNHFKLPTQIKAWIWRRRGFFTMIGERLRVEDNHEHFIEYWATGVKR